MIQGKVGKKNLIWKTTPQGRSGEGLVTVEGREINCRWIRDEQGIWIETDLGFFGYEVRKTSSEEGVPQYLLVERNGAEHSVSLGFLKAGEEQDPAATNRVKKAAKIKSQMPGKIVRILVKTGDAVKKGQSLLVM